VLLGRAVCRMLLIPLVLVLRSVCGCTNRCSLCAVLSASANLCLEDWQYEREEYKQMKRFLLSSYATQNEMVRFQVIPT